MKRNNVTITPEAFKMLIEEYHLKPHLIMARPEKQDTRIKSTKSNRFIHVGGKAYMDLIHAGHSDESLLRRKEGFIKIPTSKLPIKVFGKKFNELIKNGIYDLDTLLDLPRLEDYKVTKPKTVKPKKEKVIIEEEPVLIKVTKPKKEKVIIEEDPVLIKSATILCESNQLLVDKEMIDYVIASNEPIAIFTNDIHYEENEVKNFNNFHMSAGIFNKGKLINAYKGVEYSANECEIDYFYENVDEKITNCNEYINFINENTDEHLRNIYINQIDLFSLSKLYKKYGHEYDKKEMMSIIENKYKLYLTHQDKMIPVIKLHMWFLMHMKLLNIPNLNDKVRKFLGLTQDDEDDFETFKEVKETKKELGQDIIQYYNILINYFNS